MPDDVTFLMGKFPARLPGDLVYTRTHMWAREVQPGRWRFGFTAYAIRLMQDVYFLDWHISPGDSVRRLQEIGHIETSKAVSDLFAPLTGTLVQFNQELLQDPSGINIDGYGAGWLFEMDGPGDDLITAQQYHDHLAVNWDKTQAMIKGKINLED